MDKHFCPYCMTPVNPGESCPACGLTAGQYVASPHHLPPGTILQDRYLVGRALGEGGFGITYIGCDLRLELKVAIKEYYPVNCATRNAEATLNVTRFIGPAEVNFERGKQKFLEEARTMARLDKQRSIVGVRDFFEANNTAYIVMEYVEGTTFAQLTEQRGGRIPPEELFRIIEPLFDALQTLHEQGLIHRDISPDNLMLESGEVRLLDFGCAREATHGTETMTVALKHDYAPLEQYQQKGQGPWTDIYALCATIYLCLTGQAPPQALDRIAEDTLIRPTQLGVPLTEAQEMALLKGLRIQPRRRFQTMQELKNALYSTEELVEREEPFEEEQTEQPKNKRWPLFLAIGAVALTLLIVGMVWITKDRAKRADSNNAVRMTEWNEEVFESLLDDVSIDAIIVGAGQPDEDVYELRETRITKPIRVEEGVELFLVNSTIEGEGRIDVEGTLTVLETLRLVGKEPRLQIASTGQWNAETALIWADSTETFGNAETANIGHRVIGSGEITFDRAIEVESYEELITAKETGTPIRVVSDLSLEDDVLLQAPLWVDEGVVFDTNGHTLAMTEGVLLNRGAMYGSYQIAEQADLVNEGELRQMPDRDNGCTIQLEDGRCVLNYNDACLASSTVQGNGALYNFGSISLYGLAIKDGDMFNYSGEVRVVEEAVALAERGRLLNASNFHVLAGALLDNNGCIHNRGTLEIMDEASMNNRGVLNNIAVFLLHREARLNIADGVIYGGDDEEASVLEHYQIHGAVFIGEEPADFNAFAIRADHNQTDGLETVSSLDELLRVQESASVQRIELQGDLTCDTDLLLTKPLIITGSLTMTQGTTLTVEDAGIDSYHTLTVYNLKLTDKSSFTCHGGGAPEIEFLSGGRLEMDRSLLTGYGWIDFGETTTLTMTNRSAIVLNNTFGGDFTEKHLEEGSVYVMGSGSARIEYKH